MGFLGIELTENLDFGVSLPYVTSERWSQVIFSQIQLHVFISQCPKYFFVADPYRSEGGIGVSPRYREIVLVASSSSLELRCDM